MSFTTLNRPGVNYNYTFNYTPFVKVDSITIAITPLESNFNYNYYDLKFTSGSDSGTLKLLKTWLCLAILRENGSSAAVNYM